MVKFGPTVDSQLLLAETRHSTFAKDLGFGPAASVVTETGEFNLAIYPP